MPRTPKRSDGNTQISISLDADLLAQIDQRAASLRMSRSRYLCYLAENDLIEQGSFPIQPAPVGTYKLSPQAMARNDDASAAPPTPQKPKTTKKTAGKFQATATFSKLSPEGSPEVEPPSPSAPSKKPSR